MASLTVKRSSFRQILLAVKAKLLVREVLTTDQIKITKVPVTAPHLTADQMVYLVPRRETPQGNFDDGSGRYDRRCQRLLDIWVVTRRMLDVPGESLHFLTDADEGHFALEDSVIDAIDLEALYDDDGNQIVNEPIRFTGIEEPQRDRTKDVRTQEWGFSVIHFDVNYSRAMTGSTNNYDRE